MFAIKFFWLEIITIEILKLAKNVQSIEKEKWASQTSSLKGHYVK